MLQSGDFADVTLIVGPEPSSSSSSSSSQKIFKCHNCILAAKSGYFKRLFYGSNAFIENTTSSVKLPEQQPEIIEKMLGYIYSGGYYYGTTEKQIENHAKMFCAAASFDVEGLRLLAMDRFAYWVDDLLYCNNNSTTAKKNNGGGGDDDDDDDLGNVFECLSMIWSQTSRADRGAILLMPIAQNLERFLALPNNQFRQFVDGYSDMAFELLLALQESVKLPYASHSKYEFKSRAGVSFCPQCSSLTGLCIVCDKCKGTLREVNESDAHLIDLYCESEGCQGIADYARIVCSSCEGKKGCLAGLDKTFA